MTESITPEPIQEPVSVDDNSSSLTVDGTVTANLAAGTNNIGDVDVLSIAAGDNNIGNVDIVTVPAPLSTTGGGTEAAALRVTVASDSTGVVSVDDNGSSLTVDAATLTTIAGAVSGTEMQVDVVAALPAGTNAIGKLAANSGVDIGDVDVTSVTPGTAAGSLGKAEDGAHTTGDTGVAMLAVRRDAEAVGSDTDGDYSTVNVDGSGRVWTHDGVLDAALSGSELQVDVVGALPAGTNNIGDVDVLSIAAGDNNIGNVDIVTMPDATVIGKAADGAAVSGNPVLIAGQDGTNVQSLKTDTSGELQIDVLSIAAGDTNIGNVDIVTVPAPLSTTGGGTEATALRVTVASDSTGVLSVDDNGASLTVDVGTALPAGTNVIGGTNPDVVASASLSNVNDAATSTSLLASNSSRKGCYIFNDSTAALYVKYGATASATSFTVKIAAGGFWEMPTRPVYTGALDGIWASDASGAARITEL